MTGHRTINLNIVCHECVAAAWVRDGQMGETHYADHWDVLFQLGKKTFIFIKGRVADNVIHNGY